MIFDLQCVRYAILRRIQNNTFFIYSNQMWKNIKQKLNLNQSLSDNISDWLEFSDNNLKNKGFIYDIVDTAASTRVWHIWIERNQWIFKNHIIPARVRLELIPNDCKIIISKYKYTLATSSNEIKITKKIGLILLPFRFRY